MTQRKYEQIVTCPLCKGRAALAIVRDPDFNFDPAEWQAIITCLSCFKHYQGKLSASPFIIT